MQTTEQIAAVLDAIKAGQTVTVKYTVRGGGPNRPFERWIDVSVNRRDNGTIYCSAHDVVLKKDVYIRTVKGQNLIRIDHSEWYVIAGADSPFIR